MDNDAVIAPLHCESFLLSFHQMVQVELSGRRISFLEDALGVFATDNGTTVEQDRDQLYESAGFFFLFSSLFFAG